MVLSSSKEPSSSCSHPVPDHDICHTAKLSRTRLFCSYPSSTSPPPSASQNCDDRLFIPSSPATVSFLLISGHFAPLSHPWHTPSTISTIHLDSNTSARLDSPPSAMPYNTSAIPPRQEPTGETSLPRETHWTLHALTYGCLRTFKTI